MAIREGAWDCPACGREGNRGSHKFCGGCGRPRGEDITFYLPDDAKEITDKALLAKAQSGPDWQCPYCSSDNPGDADFCTGCGAPKSGKQRKVQDIRFDQPPAEPKQPLTAPATTEPQPKKRGCLYLIIALVLIALIAGYCLTRTRETQLTVTAMTWEHTLVMEQYQPVTEKAWQGEVPAGAREISRSREVHHVNRVQTGTRTRTRTVSEQVQTGTRKVKVGVRDLGNGFFEDIYEDQPVYETRQREETYQEPVYQEDPVYRERITYEIWRWLATDNLTAQGSGPDTRWPAEPDDKHLRVKERKARYGLTLRDGKGKTYDYTPKNLAEFQVLIQAERFPARVNALGQIKEILLHREQE